jgi:hypothetical protein
MTNPRIARFKRWLAILTVVLLFHSSSGCLLVAGGAAAGAASYAYYRGNVRQVVYVDFPTAWQATQYALADLGMPVTPVSHDARSGVLRSYTGTGDKILIRLEEQIPKIPADPAQTEIGIRIATFGDQDVSMRIFQQINARLATAAPVTYSPPAVPPAPAPTPAGAALSDREPGKVTAAGE